METTLDTKCAKNYTCAKRETALNNKMHRIQKNQEQRAKKENDQKKTEKKQSRCRNRALRPMTKHDKP